MTNLGMVLCCGVMLIPVGILVGLLLILRRQQRGRESSLSELSSRRGFTYVGDDADAIGPLRELLEPSLLSSSGDHFLNVVVRGELDAGVFWFAHHEHKVRRRNQNSDNTFRTLLVVPRQESGPPFTVARKAKGCLGTPLTAMVGLVGGDKLVDLGSAWDWAFVGPHDPGAKLDLSAELGERLKGLIEDGETLHVRPEHLILSAPGQRIADWLEAGLSRAQAIGEALDAR